MTRHSCIAPDGTGKDVFDGIGKFSQAFSKRGGFSFLLFSTLSELVFRVWEASFFSAFSTFSFTDCSRLSQGLLFLRPELAGGRFDDCGFDDILMILMI